MHTQLRLRGANPTSVFALLGQDENSATAALGWTLAHCPSFLHGLLWAIIRHDIAVGEEVLIELQRSHEVGGFTDIEVVVPNRLHVIVEAKRDWTVPTIDQLARYRQRLQPDTFPHTAIVSLSAASQDYASKRLPRDLDGVQVEHLSWSAVQKAVRAVSRQSARMDERVWLTHLDKHLESYVAMQNPRDNSVFVVALSQEPIRDGSPYTWVDVVERDARYFHPYGNHWPLLPPNYIGFRYGGQMRSVHRIEAFEVVADLTAVDARWPNSDREHMVYRLGPAMRPPSKMSNGSIYRAAHAWCAIDTLLSGAFETISDARDETNRRLATWERAAAT